MGTITTHPRKKGPTTYGYSIKIERTHRRKQGFENRCDAELAMEAVRNPTMENVLAPGFNVKREASSLGRQVMHQPGLYLRKQGQNRWFVYWRVQKNGVEHTGIAPSVLEALLDQAKIRPLYGWKSRRRTTYPSVWRVLDRAGDAHYQFETNYTNQNGDRRKKRGEAYKTAKGAAEALRKFQVNAGSYVSEGETPTISAFLEKRLTVYVDNGKDDRDMRRRYREIAAFCGEHRLVTDLNHKDVDGFWFYVQNRLAKPGHGWKRGRNNEIASIRVRKALWYTFTGMVKTLGELGYLDVREVGHDGAPSILYSAISKKWPDGDRQAFAPLRLTEHELVAVVRKLRERPDKAAALAACNGDKKKAGRVYAAQVRTGFSRRRAALMLDVSYYTAMRLGGLRRLRWRDFDEETIEHYDDKGGRSWRMPIHPDLYAELKDFGNDVSPSHRNPDDLVFLNPTTGVAVASVKNALDWAVAETGVPRFTFRDVRPLAITAVQAGGHDARCLTRWKSPRMLAEYDKQLGATAAVTSLGERRRDAGGEVLAFRPKAEPEPQTTTAKALDDLLAEYHAELSSTENLAGVGDLAFRFMNRVAALTKTAETKHDDQKVVYAFER